MLPLNANQLQILREKLRTMELDLKASEAQRQQDGAAVELDQTRVGRLSRMDAMQQQAQAQAASRRAAEQLLRVRTALRRLDDGIYGSCIDCDEPIGIQRLVADPCAPVCLECQKFRDQDAADEERRLRNQGRR